MPFSWIKYLLLHLYSKNFEINFHILSESYCIHFISTTNDLFCIPHKIVEIKSNIRTKIFKMKICLCAKGVSPPLNPYFNIILTWIKHFKSLFKSGRYLKILREIWAKIREEKDRFSQISTALHIVYKFFCTM